MANFKPLNRYTNGTITQSRNGTQFLVLRKSLNLPLDNTDVTVSITQHLLNRPDTIAQLAYGNTDLWWVIYEYNGIRDPFFDLKLGQLIRIPRLDRVREAISKIGT